MTPRIGFYHLQKTSLEHALPLLLGKVLKAGQRAVVMAGSTERVVFLDQLLWTSEPDSWIPHGSARDGNADLQPIYLTAEDENPNRADVLLLTDGVVSNRLADFSRCLTLFDGKDEEQLALARRQWSALKAQGAALSYWKQGAQGGWEKQA